MLLIRFLQTVIVLCVVGIILIVFQSGAASARQGVFVRDYVGYNATTVLNFDRPEVARTFYSELKPLGRPAIYSFKAKKDFLLQAKIYIPVVDGLEDYRPALALFGPGLPQPTPDQLDHLPFSLPPDSGMVLSEQVVNLGEPIAPLPTTYEPFTQSEYWEGQKLLREMPQDGTYYLVVFSRVGQGGRYALQVGDKTDTQIKEILGFPVLWSRVHLWFDDWLTPVLAWIALGLLVLYGLYLLLNPYLNLRRKAKILSNVANIPPAHPVMPGTLDETGFAERISNYTPAPRLRYDITDPNSKQDNHEEAQG